MYNSASLGHQREELVLVQNVSKPQQGSLQELLERAQQQLEALGQEEKDKLKENLQRQFDKRAQEALKEKQAALGKRMPFMNGRKFNWLVLAGFLVCVIAFLSFFFFFVKFPDTRDFPWANLLLFGLAAILLVIGLRRAFAKAEAYRGKIFGPILAALSVAIFGFFAFIIFVESKGLPAAHGAPQVGQKAPEFSLVDMNGRSVKLSELLTAPMNAASSVAGSSASGRTPKGVLLVFYRGYW